MGRYLRDARHHLDQIRYLYDNAGDAGYGQAEYHWNELFRLLRSAQKSKNDKADAPMIQGLLDSAKPMMDELKKKESNS